MPAGGPRWRRIRSDETEDVEIANVPGNAMIDGQTTSREIVGVVVGAMTGGSPTAGC